MYVLLHVFFQIQMSDFRLILSHIDYFTIQSHTILHFTLYRPTSSQILCVYFKTARH